MTQDAGTAERHRAGFAGVVLLLRQLAAQLLESGQADQARGLIDGLEAIEAKTKGNLDAEEAAFLEGVLYELKMAVVRGPQGSEDAAEPEAPGAEDAPDAEGGKSPE